MTILLIEDDDAVRGEIKRLLIAHGYYVIDCASSDGADGDFDLALLDIKLPGESGYEICARLRRRGCPVIFLTSVDGAASELKGFAAGADDYVRKPFDPEVLLARIARLLRVPEKRYMTRGGLTLDTARMEAAFGGKTVLLPRTEFLLLRALMDGDGIVKRRRLIERLWDSEAYIDCHIFLWTLFIKYCYTTKFNFSFQNGFDGYCDYFLADCFICE